MRRPVGVLVVVSTLLGGCATATPPSAAATPALDVAVQALHPGQVVDSIPCLGAELPSFHLHVHLDVLLDGAPVTVPAGIGVGRPWTADATGFIANGSCFSWLHTHDTTGVIHVVSQQQATYTLGQLFAVWGHPLSKADVLGFHGQTTFYVNGREFAGDPATIPFSGYASIVIELGRRVPPPGSYFFGNVRR